jgi:hypothetical protein
MISIPDFLIQLSFLPARAADRSARRPKRAAPAPRAL